MSKLSFEHINKVYPSGFQAIKDFNLEIEDQEFIVVIGPSGCGKSTILRMVAGMEEISSGVLKIDEDVMNDVEAKNRDIAMIFQNYAVYEDLTVYENLAFGLKLRKLPKDKIDKLVREAAQILNLEQLLKRKPKALSVGQRHRVAMGRAIVLQPKVYLMEEPLSNIATKYRGQVRIEIARLHQELGATIIYVTNDQTEAMSLATRIVVLCNGVIQQIDTPDALYNAPCNLFVAGFIGTPKMNFLDVTCKQNGEHMILQTGHSELLLSPEKSKKLIEGGYHGKTVVLGIRPEDIHDEPMFLRASPETIIEVEIHEYEMSGTDGVLSFMYEGVEMTAIVNPKTKARRGSIVKFAFDAEKIHIFDKETELAIINE